jgi:hypothetical protein
MLYLLISSVLEKNEGKKIIFYRVCIRFFAIVPVTDLKNRWKNKFALGLEPLLNNIFFTYNISLSFLHAI